MTGSAPFVSVVTPVYNCGEYLEQCVESILGQTFTDFEYIIVNNCSTDDTLDVARRFEAKDRRIRVHSNTEFVGVCDNHNIAFSLISPESKYCKVVSADDFIFPNCLEQLVGFAVAHPSVGMVNCYELAGRHVMHAGLEYERNVVSGRDVCRDNLLGRSYVFGSPNSLLYRADLVRKNAKFFPIDERLHPNSRVHADVSACFEALKTSDFGFVHQVLAYCRIRSASESSRSLKYGTFKSSLISDVLNYGRFYLTPEEYDARLADAIDGYYNWLVKRIYENRGDKEFWDIQKTSLQDLGLPFNRAKLYRTAVLRTMEELGSPRAALKKVMGLGKSSKEIEAKYYFD